MGRTVFQEVRGEYSLNNLDSLARTYLNHFIRRFLVCFLAHVSVDILNKLCWRDPLGALGAFYFSAHVQDPAGANVEEVLYNLDTSG